MKALGLILRKNKMEKIIFDGHYHGGWRRYEDDSREGPRTLENFSRHLFNTELDVCAFTEFRARSVPPIWQELLSTAKSREYEFDFRNQGFDVSVYRKSDGARKDITLTQEIQTKDGHLLALFSHELITPHKKADEVARQIINSGGKVVSAHSLLLLVGIGERKIRELAGKEYNGARLLSFLEWNSGLPPILYNYNFRAERLARKLGISMIANTDGYHWDSMGDSYSVFLSCKKGVEGIKEIIDRGPSEIKKSKSTIMKLIEHLTKTGFFHPSRLYKAIP